MGRQLAIAIFGLLATVGAYSVCNSTAYLPDHFEVPCVLVPSCSAGASTVEIAMQSNGTSKFPAPTTVAICYSDDGLQLSYSAANDTQLMNTYTECNSPMYNQEVVEVFITPGVDDSAHYIELEVSPFNAMYLARITNQYLNGSVLNHTMIDCGSSGVKHWTVPSSYDHSFTAQVQLPWSLVSNVTAQGPPSTVWRVNFFRVLMLEATDFCTPQECSYGAWSPTFVWPPAFHHSAYFGVLVLA